MAGINDSIDATILARSRTRPTYLRHDAKLGDPLWAKGIRAPKIQQRRTRAQFFHRSTMSTNFLSRASPREMASSVDSLSSVASRRADGEKLGPRGSRKKSVGGHILRNRATKMTWENKVTVSSLMPPGW